MYKTERRNAHTKQRKILKRRNKYIGQTFYAEIHKNMKGPEILKTELKYSGRGKQIFVHMQVLKFTVFPTNE